MAILKCKMCGGELKILDGMTVAECEYCGSRQTVPTADNEKKMTLFARANRLRAANEFDKAAGVYESIVADFPEEAEAYWGLVLCRFGIEYVDDPATGKKIPTCHRSSFDSIMDDSDFEQVMENADPVARRVYRDEAKAIEEIRRSIIEVSSKEEPYDIFICYKETDENGDRTIDSVIAQDVYDRLTERGYKVFFSRITLEDKLGQEYEPYIFSALNSAKVMLAFGTDYEYYNAVWVKNEWSRFLALIAKGDWKTLIPCYKDISAYDIPKEFRHLQAQDMGKVGAMQDLLRGIDKIIPKKSKQIVKETVFVNSGSSSADPLLKRVFMYLEDGVWDRADEYAEMVLAQDPENAEAYIGKLMAALHIYRREDIKNQLQSFSDNENFKKAFCFADAKTKDELNGYLKHINERIASEKRREETERAENRKWKVFYDASDLLSNAKTLDDFIKARDQFKTIRTYDGSEEKINECQRRIKQLRLAITKKNEEKCREFREGMVLQSKTKILYSKLSEKRNRLNLIKEQDALLTKRSKLENELSGLGKFAFSRKKEITKELEKIQMRQGAIQKELVPLSSKKMSVDFDAEKAEFDKLKNEFSQAKAELEKKALWKAESKSEKYGIKKGSILLLNSGVLNTGVLGCDSDLKGYLQENSIEFVVIPDGATGIDDEAFSDCKSLMEVLIPKSVILIGDKAFYGCQSLTNISIPESVKSIGNETFYRCQSLSNVLIPESVDSIGKLAFYGCLNLTAITIPESVKSIGEDAFSCCETLTNILIPAGVTSIGKNAFSYCESLVKLSVDPFNKTFDSRENCNCIIEISENKIIAGCSSAVIPESVVSIKEDAFEGCENLTSVMIPAGVTSIGDGAFKRCGRLTEISVDPLNKTYDSRNDCNAIIESAENKLVVGCGSTVIPDSVTSIGDRAFLGSENFSGITIPDSVTGIGDGAFCSCNNLISVTIPDSVSSIGDSAFCCCKNLTSITLSDNVTSIGAWVFSDCTNLTSVTIPAGVTSIGNWAFSDCTNLTSVTIPAGVISIGEEAFSNCENLTSITLSKGLTSIGGDAFSKCKNLTSVTIPNSVTSIGNNAFYGCKNLKSVIIPNSVTSIGFLAFAGCENLTRITIPDSVTSIGFSTFRDCKNLTTVTIPESVTNFRDTFSGCPNLTSATLSRNTARIGDDMFQYCDHLTKITIPDSVTSIGKDAFSGCKKLTRITIPDSVTSIADGMFQYCENLSFISIPESVTSIGRAAFSGCKKLNSVTIPESVTSIGVGAFEGCTNFTSITIPDSVTSIGFSAFGGCDNLWEVTVPAGITSFGNIFFQCPNITRVILSKGGTSIRDSAFYHCKTITSITIPDSVTGIGNSAFNGCENLSSITIPDSVTSIGDSAFAFCDSLTNVLIPDSVRSIGDGAFKFCDNLTSVSIPAGVKSIGSYVVDKNVIIMGEKGSFAEKYANDNSIQFCDI